MQLGSWYNISVHEHGTAIALLSRNHDQKLHQKFDIFSQRFWYLKIVAISAKKNWSFSWTTGFLKLLSGVSQGVWNCVFVLYTFLALLGRKHKEKKSSVIDNISRRSAKKNFGI